MKANLNFLEQHSHFSQCSLDCFVASLLAMTYWEFVYRLDGDLSPLT